MIIAGAVVIRHFKIIIGYIGSNNTRNYSLEKEMEALINDREMKKEINMIENSIEKILSELEKLNGTVSEPVKLRAVKHRDGYQYFLRREKSDTNGEYIRKEEITKAITLAKIEYDEKLLVFLRNAKNALEKCIASEVINPYEAALNEISSGKRVLIESHYLSDEDYIKRWKEQEYECLFFKEGYPEYYTRKGLRVRSKSEVIIADILDELSIPFLYEKPLQLKKKTVHPDFTLLNIKERNEVYWEHFGMMDDRDYRDEALLKIREYEANGLYQHNSVIWTFESGKYPINTRDIRKMIKNLCDALGY